jgi:hypothetical protein
MKQIRCILAGLAGLLLIGCLPPFASAAQLEYVGTHYDIGDTFFPAYNFPNQCCFTPWHSDSGSNVFSVKNTFPDRYYGTDGWALFGTKFDFPNANATGEQFYLDTDDPQFPNVFDLPGFVTDSLILTLDHDGKAGGGSAALIDDPARQAGLRQWTFDGVNYPPADGTNTTGSVPYLKIGFLHGWDKYGNHPSTGPSGRWGFAVGSDVPQRFRIGVMTDGLASKNYAPGEVLLYQVDLSDEYFYNSFLATASTGTIPYDDDPLPFAPGTNRFVDMHFFDIVDAQPGDFFAIAAQSYPGQDFAGVSGVSFDVLPISGDYNRDGIVDAADFTKWRDTLGQTVKPGFGADGDYSGTIDQGDFAEWKSRFGRTAGSGALSAATAPEPCPAILILGVAAIGILARRSRLV